MMFLLRALARIDEGWIGDLIGALCLFVGGYGLLLIGYGAGLK